MPHDITVAVTLVALRNLITISLLLLTTATAGATSVTGNVSGTWSLAGSPYIVDGDVTVPTGQTLTIAPGVEVRTRANRG